MSNPCQLSDAAIEFELLLSQLTESRDVMLVFNQRDGSKVITGGEIQFIEDMFDVDSRMKELKGLNVLSVNAGNGQGFNELHKWIQYVSSDKKKQASVE